MLAALEEEEMSSHAQGASDDGNEDGHLGSAENRSSSMKDSQSMRTIINH